MGKPSDSPGFKKLLEEWNRRLADSGFKDVEELKGGQLVLKKTGTMIRYEQSSDVVREARVEYYRIVSRHVANTHFSNEIDRMILTLYCEGLSQVDIKERLPKRMHRATIYKRLYKYLRLWGIK